MAKREKQRPAPAIMRRLNPRLERLMKSLSDAYEVAEILETYMHSSTELVRVDAHLLRSSAATIRNIALNLRTR